MGKTAKEKPFLITRMQARKILLYGMDELLRPDIANLFSGKKVKEFAAAREVLKRSFLSTNKYNETYKKAYQKGFRDGIYKTR